MKILWVTNIELNPIANQFGDSVVLGGWLEQTAPLLRAREGVELSIACQSRREYTGREVDGIQYYSFDNTRDTLPARIADILERVKPDVIHIWGTEYTHSHEMLRVLKEKGQADRAVVSIQGLVSIYPYHYFTGLPAEVIRHRTLKERIRRTGLAQARQEMARRGETEVQTLKLAQHCIGRTDWDYACTRQINPDLRYHHCDEILREEFYKGEWSRETCERHTLFFSQANYPIKGFHIMLEAMRILRRKYPDIRLRVLGKNPVRSGFHDRIRQETYPWYLSRKTREYGLEDCIDWLGRLNASQMKAEYLRANAFVCASSIENSSNSVCEAMLLGVPVVASDVGGIKSLLEHRREGILYQESAFYMLADGIDQVFSDDCLAAELGKNARARAQRTHDRGTIIDRLMGIYQEINAELCR